jgi:hypothetical protein
MTDPIKPQGKLADALDGQTPDPVPAAPGQIGPEEKGESPGVVSEQTRRGPEDTVDKRNETRDDHLVEIGRAHQTHG